MIDISILENSLNERVSYAEYFHALGYADNDIIYFRTFDDKDRDEYGRNQERPLSKIDNILPRLREENTHDRGVFYVVNGGGQSDANVTTPRAQFIDIDDFSFTEQIDLINDFELEPSIIVKTKKSLHCYYLLENGDIEQFRPLQERLIQYFGSDPSIKNESRVMRLYGFEHRKDDPVTVTLIKFDPDLVYTQAEISDALPELEPEARTEAAAEKAYKKEFIEKGHRHEYVVSKIGEVLGKLKDSAGDDAILALVETDLLSKCEAPEDITQNIKAFRKKYLKTIQTFRARQKEAAEDPEYYAKAVRAWAAENPGEFFDPERHTWQEVREAYERAKENDAAGRRESNETTIRQDNPPVQAETAENAPQDATGAALDFSELPGLLTYDAAVNEFETANDQILELRTFPEFSKRAKIKLHDSVVIAADTGAGKSSLALNFINDLNDRYPVIYFNLEMDALTVLRRLVSIRTGIKLDVIEGYQHDSHTKLVVNSALKAITARKQLQILQNSYNLTAIEAEIRRATVRRDDPTIVIIDHSLLVKTDAKISRYERFTHISEELRRVSRENNIILFVLLQQNREGKRDEDERPKNYSLKESGSWENDATHIVFLWYDPTAGRKKLILTKNRSGESGEVIVDYFAPTQIYQEAKDQPQTFTDKPRARSKTQATKRDKARQNLQNAFEKALIATSGNPTLYDIAEAAGVTTTTVKNWLKEYGGYTVNGESYDAAGIDVDVEKNEFVRLTLSEDAESNARFNTGSAGDLTDTHKALSI